MTSWLEAVDRLAKAGHPETLNAGQRMNTATIPMAEVWLGKVLGDYRLAGLQSYRLR